MARRVGAGIRRAIGVWWDAVSGGAFLTRWSAILSLVVAGTVSVPTVAEATLHGYLAAVVVATLGWVVLAVVVVPAAFAERRLRSRGARAAVVLGAVLVAALLRTPVNNALSLLLWGTPTAGSWGPRTVTNLLTAFVLFSIVGIATTQFAQRHLVADRLTEALDLMRRRLRRAEERVSASERLLVDVVLDLRAARDAMLAGLIDFDRVRAYAERVRAASHGLAQTGGADGLDGDPASDGQDAAAPRRTLLSGLIPTPWLVVALIYNVASLPFALTAGSPLVVGIGYLGVFLLDLAAGVLTRIRRFQGATPGSVRPSVFLTVWVLAGAGVAALTFALLPNIQMLTLVGIVAIPAAAVTLSLCVDAMRRVRSAERQSARVLARVAQYVARATARADDPLLRASGLLHGRVQGRCVILAAQAEDERPTAEEIAAFREQTDAAFDAILDLPPQEEAASVPGGAGPVARLLAAWSGVVTTTVRVGDGAAAALADPATAQHAADAVNEALVNAVKHSTARVAAVEIDLTPEGRVRVRISSRGTLAAAADRTSGLGERAVGVEIRQQGDDVVLDSVLPAAV